MTKRASFFEESPKNLTVLPAVWRFLSLRANKKVDFKLNLWE